MPSEFRPAKPQPKLGFFARIADDFRALRAPAALERRDPGAASAYRLMAVTIRIASPKMTHEEVHAVMLAEALRARAREAKRRR